MLLFYILVDDNTFQNNYVNNNSFNFNSFKVQDRLVHYKRIQTN